MHYAPKHAALHALSVRSRVLGIAALGSATVAATLAVASPANAASGSVWDRVASCESGGNWSIATGNGYYGGLQFSASSWRAAGGTAYASLPHRATRAQQIAIAQKLLKAQGPGAWPVCSRKAGLTRANGLAEVVNTGASAGTSASAASVATVRSARHALGSSWATRAQVRTVQSWLGQARTGTWSRANTKALQAKAGAKVDGVVGRETVNKTEKLVHAKVTKLSYFTPASLRSLTAYAAR
jgi:resuscitation-promoting factor RpfA